MIGSMCRNIKTLFNFAPSATDDEIHAASAQFIRKLSGLTKPSRANQAAFDRVVDGVVVEARQLLDSLVIVAPPRDRARAELRFGTDPGQTGGAEEIAR